MLSDKSYNFCQEDQEIVVGAPPALSTEPEVRPTPLPALAFNDVPAELHFVRSHFTVPTLDPASWRLEVNGAVERELSFSLPKLKRRPVRTQTVVLECAGHRRNEFHPATPGLQWGVGAVSEAHWTGVSLSALLQEVSPISGACEVVFEAADSGLHRSSTNEVTFARSIPLERALAGDVLLAWGMNGHPIPARHGAPLRVIVPGSYGVASVKWLRRISVLERPFTGPFQVDDYHLNGKPLPRVRVNSLIVEPSEGSTLLTGATEVSGVAWGGPDGIAAVEVRVSGGPWQQTMLISPAEPNRLSRWRAAVSLPPGEHRLEARARDFSGVLQPERAMWNPLGYANNSIHAIRVRSVSASGHSQQVSESRPHP